MVPPAVSAATSASSMSEAARLRSNANRREALRLRAEAQQRRDSKKRRCSECGGTPNPILSEYFDVWVCDSHRTVQMDLIPATQATEQYLLPKATLNELPSVDRKNPRGFTQSMKLYLRRDLERAATKRFGSIHDLQAERVRRNAANWQRRAKKAASFFSVQ